MFEKGVVFEYEEVKYIVLEEAIYNGKKYIFTNELLDDEEEGISEDFYTFEVIDDNDLEIIDDEIIIQNVFQLVQDDLVKDINDVLKEGE